MKPSVALLAVAVLTIAACSESSLPTAAKSGLQPRFGTSVQGGCPVPFTLSPTFDADGIAADRNGDGYACFLTDPQDAKVIITWTDNNVPLSQIGGCPNGFTLQYVMTYEGNGDTNGDGMVCTRTSGNGSTIVIDNNHRT